MSVPDARLAHDARFRTTRWNLVRAAGDSRHVESRAAMAELCQGYWFPVYAYFRRRTGNAMDAQDLTQEFFATLLERNYLRSARQDRGRFRTFLLTAAQRFLSKEQAKSRALKRGGGKPVLAIDFSSGESWYATEPMDETPERSFDRRWALSLLEIAQQRLCDEYTANGKRRTYELLKPFLTGTNQPDSYAQVAGSLGKSVGAVKTSVYRMRCRYRELLLAEISETVADPAEVDDEVKQLFAALA